MARPSAPFSWKFNCLKSNFCRRAVALNHQRRRSFNRVERYISCGCTVDNLCEMWSFRIKRNLTLIEWLRSDFNHAISIAFVQIFVCFVDATIICSGRFQASAASFYHNTICSKHFMVYAHALLTSASKACREQSSGRLEGHHGNWFICKNSHTLSSTLGKQLKFNWHRFQNAHIFTSFSFYAINSRIHFMRLHFVRLQWKISSTCATRIRYTFFTLACVSHFFSVWPYHFY